MKKVLTSLTAVVIALLMLLPQAQVFTQNDDHEHITDGTEYWLGIPHCNKEETEPIRNGEYPIMLWVSSKVDTRATVSADAIGYQKTFQISANKTTIVELNDYLMMKKSEEKESWGIHVQGDDPLTVCVYMSYKWSGEAFRCIPVEWLGKTYVTTNLYLDRTDRYLPPQILIIATDDNTTVWYTPTAHTVKYDKGSTGSVKMNRGDTYLIEGRIEGQKYLKQDWVTDLTGTYIEANKPIAVVSGHTKGAFPRYQAGMPANYQLRWANFLRNMIIEMMWPIDLLGTEYISAPIKYNNRTRGLSQVQDDFGDLIRLIATEDDTELYQMRQDGSGFMKIGRTLNRGEWHNLNNQEDAAFYRSTKPVLAAQYGKTWMNESVPGGDDDGTEKDDDNDHVQNPHLAGQGMLLVLAPLDHWTNYAQFRSPGGIDNFIYVTFKDDDLFHIKYDGQPITAKFGAAVRPIYGTEYSYITETVGPGDHALTADSGATFAAYAYGNWDRTKDGFAYGYPTGINYASPCEDSVYIEDEMECGDVEGTAYVVPEDSSCAILFNVLFRSAYSYNYEFEVEDFDRTTAKHANFWLNIINPKDSAKGVVTAMTRSGRTATKTYIYIPEQIIADPDYLNFGLLQVDETKCFNVTLRNPGEIETTVTELKLKHGRAEFKITSTDLPVTLQPGEETEIEVCATALDEYEQSVRDTVVAVLSCFEEDIVALELKSGAPEIWISDANWGKVPVDTEKPHNVYIENQGDTPAEVYTIDWPDKDHFPRISGLDLPLSLEPGDRHTFIAYFITDVAGVEHTTRADFTANTTEVKLYSDWVGEGIDAGPTIGSYDWLRRRVIDQFNDSTEYEWSVPIENVGNTKLDVNDVYISDDFGGVFRVDKSNMPNQLDPQSPVWLKVYFAPKENDGIDEYETDIIIEAEFNNEAMTDKGVLHGIGTQPHIAVVGDTLDTPVLVTQSADMEGIISSFELSDLSAMELQVYDVDIDGTDKTAFEIKDEFFDNYIPPFTMSSSETINVPILFTAEHLGDHEAYIITDDDAPEAPLGWLLAPGETIGLNATDHDFGTMFRTLTSDVAQVYAENTGSKDATLTGPLFIAGQDINNFKLVRYYLESTGEESPTTLPSGDRIICDVNFSPDAVRDYEAKIDYVTDVGTVTSRVYGEGMELLTICDIPDDYRMFPGHLADLQVNILKHPDEEKHLIEANILEFEVKIYFNEDENKDIIEVIPFLEDINSDIGTHGTMTDGWTVADARVVGDEYLYVRFIGTQPLRGSGHLFSFKVKSFLSDLTEVHLPIEFIPINRDYVVVENRPGKIVINPVCVNTLRHIVLTNVNYSLSAPNPNPASGITTINYSVGLEANTTIELYDGNGSKVRTLVDERLKPGQYQLIFDISRLGLSSGVYQYRINSGPFSEIKPLMIVR